MFLKKWTINYSLYWPISFTLSQCLTNTQTITAKEQRIVAQIALCLGFLPSRKIPACPSHDILVEYIIGIPDLWFFCLGIPNQWGSGKKTLYCNQSTGLCLAQMHSAVNVYICMCVCVCAAISQTGYDPIVPIVCYYKVKAWWILKIMCCFSVQIYVCLLMSTDVHCCCFCIGDQTSFCF